MNDFILFASPFWVNFFILIPFGAYYVWRKRGLEISKRIFIVTALFGIAFGFVEAAVVIYLRAAIGLLPGYIGTLSEVARLSADIYQQIQVLDVIPKSLLVIEILRELATIVILGTIAYLSVKNWRERSAIFLWVFAIWDIFYYIGFWATVRWPESLLTQDVLFLIPTPWLSQVWFPLLISALSIIAIIFTNQAKKKFL